MVDDEGDSDSEGDNSVSRGGKARSVSTSVIASQRPDIDATPGKPSNLDDLGSEVNERMDGESRVTESLPGVPEDANVARDAIKVSNLA